MVAPCKDQSIKMQTLKSDIPFWDRKMDTATSSLVCGLLQALLFMAEGQPPRLSHKALAEQADRASTLVELVKQARCVNRKAW